MFKQSSLSCSHGSLEDEKPERNAERGDPAPDLSEKNRILFGTGIAAI